MTCKFNHRKPGDISFCKYKFVQSISFNNLVFERECKMCEKVLPHMLKAYKDLSFLYKLQTVNLMPGKSSCNSISGNLGVINY